MRLSILLVLAAVLTVRAEVSPQGFRDAAAYSRAHGGRSLLVNQDGHVITDGETGRRFPIFSGTKMFWCLATLAAAQDGLLDLDEPVSNTITEWRGRPDRNQITIRQLLNFTSGLDPASRLHRVTCANRDREAMKLDIVAPPGHAFIYGPGQLQVLDELLRRKLHGGSTTRYLEHRILHPLDIYDVDYRRDRAGNPLLASGFELTATEWEKVGRLLLNGGSLGLRTLVKRDLLEQCFHGTDANPAFGMILWLNRESGASEGREVDVESMLDLDWSREDWRHAYLSREAPADLVVSLGSFGQRLYVAPSIHLIVIRQGEGSGFRDAIFLQKLLSPQGTTE